MLNIIGGTLIILASTSIGIFAAQRLGARTKQIRELQMIIQMLETEISYASSPLEVAFAKASQGKRGLMAALFAECESQLKASEGATTSECWEKALTAFQGRFALKSNEIEWLQHFGQVIGTSDRYDQLKHLELLMSQLKHAEAESREDQRKYEKMYRTLGFLAGALIVILLI
jgi:stage III sporulation protein AB